LIIALAAAALTNVLLSTLLTARGDKLEDALQGTGLLLSVRIMDPTGIDSWRPMLAAYDHNVDSPGSLYWVFLAKGIKFQYPPSSLLVMPLLPFPMDQSFRQKVAVPSYLAVFFTIMCSAMIAIKLLAPSPARTIQWREPLTFCIVVLVAMLGWLYYPLMKGHSLGQIQVYLGALIALALLFQAADYPALSGVCIGLCCLVKPQYGLALVWGLLRRELRFVLGLLITVSIGLALSLHMFGLQNHLDYLQVLGRLSRFGEAYGPNQTVNGLLQRWLENGSPIKFQSRKLPPYHPVVYYGTLATSLVFVALALFAPTSKPLRGRAIDLSVLLVASTLASPIAWEHHYGAFFPILAVALASPFAMRHAGVLLIFSYELIAIELMRPELIYTNRWTGLLGSHRFLGGLLLLVFLLLARAQSQDERTSTTAS
jgi:alpha-1,2-mannosyltransferase